MNFESQLKEIETIYLSQEEILSVAHHLYKDLWHIPYGNVFGNLNTFIIIRYDKYSEKYVCRKLKGCNYVGGSCEKELNFQTQDCKNCICSKIRIRSEGLPVTNTLEYNKKKLKKYKRP